MSRRSTLALGLLAAVAPIAAIVLPTLVARAEAPADAPPAAAPPAADSAAALPSVGRDLPKDKSKVPSVEEWRNPSLAKNVKLTRQATAPCVATQVREWLRVRCYEGTFAVSLLGGSNDGLSFWIGDESGKAFAEVQFPLRVGDRRVVQLWNATKDAAGTAVVQPGLVVQEHWIEGEASPTVTLL